ncbi:unnamed protein product [Pleuronectes platessa]|uniref:Uncharacterized protein n=1 Tax=Pleuronectes platessa TaxID=8262 RepID=A0A9N7YYS8_PLEPL|nr:unnamed protein product [Pleuronectes platessa]
MSVLQEAEEDVEEILKETVSLRKHRTHFLLLCRRKEKLLHQNKTSPPSGLQEKKTTLPDPQPAALILPTTKQKERERHTDRESEGERERERGRDGGVNHGERFSRRGSDLEATPFALFSLALAVVNGAESRCGKHKPTSALARPPPPPPQVPLNPV